MSSTFRRASPSCQRWPTRCCRAGWCPAFVPGDDPLALADVTIYLPTRRAARELRSVFVDRLGGRAAILPHHPPARRSGRGCGHLRRRWRRDARDPPGDRAAGTRAVAGAPRPGLEAPAAGPCGEPHGRRDRRSGLGRRRDLAGPRPGRADRRGRDPRGRLERAVGSRAGRTRRLVAGDARIPRDRAQKLAALPG